MILFYMLLSIVRIFPYSLLDYLQSRFDCIESNMLTVNYPIRSATEPDRHVLNEDLKKRTYERNTG